MRKKNWAPLLFGTMVLPLGAASEGCAVDGEEITGPVVSVSIPLLDDQCNVASASVRVEAPDIQTLGPVELDVDGDAISGLVQGVPAGRSRVVVVTAANALGLPVYEGRGVVDVSRDTVSPVQVTLARNFANCPAEDGEEPGGTGSVDVDGQLSNDPTFIPFGFRAVDAEYSDALDRIVTVSASPAALHLIDPTSGALETVELDLAPTSVSVAPDGKHAAVGHDGYVSYVHLEALAVLRTYPVSTQVVDLVAAGNGYVYAFPRVDQWEQIRSLELETGVETVSSGRSIRAGTLVKLHPTLEAIYGANNGLSPSDIERYDIHAGPAVYGYDSPYHGDYGMCGNLWISQDGARIFTRCGNTFRASATPTDDMTYAGALPDLTYIQELDQSAGSRLVAAIPGTSWRDEAAADTEVRFFEDAFLQSVENVTLPKFSWAGVAYDLHGKFVFFSADGTKVFVIAQVDSAAGLLDDYGLVQLSAP